MTEQADMTEEEAKEFAVYPKGMTSDLAEDIRAWARQSRHKLSRSGWQEDALEPIYFK